MLNVSFVSHFVNQMVYALESCILVWFATVGGRANGGDPGSLPLGASIRRAYDRDLGLIPVFTVFTSPFSGYDVMADWGGYIILK